MSSQTRIRECARCEEERECPYGKNYCRECQKLFCKEYKAKNKEKIAEYNKKYKAEHKEETKEYNHNYNKENRDKIKERQREQHKERRMIDYNYKRSGALRNKLLKFFKGEIKHTPKIFGCKRELLLKWFEFNFKKDMTIENHGTVWSIDHVLPCSKFNFEEDFEEEKCFNWSNLRPLYIKDNLSRQNNVLENEIIEHESLIKTFLETNKNEKIHLLKYDKLSYISKQ